MVLIIGGGIAGLSAAYELSRRNIPFLLLEASSRVGGLILTEHIEGFTLDAGPDSILVQKPAALQLCEELGLGPRLMTSRPPRTAFVLKGRRLHALSTPSVLGIPLSVPATLRYDLLSWRARGRLLLERFIPPGASPDESVASFFRRRFGPEAVDLIAAPLLGGIHAGDIDQLSVASLFPRLVEAERQPGGVIANLARRAPSSGDGLFRALRDGMSELVTAIVSTLPPDSIRTGTRVASLRRNGSSWEAVTTTGSYDAEAVIVAAPAHAAAALFESIDAVAAHICRQVPYASTASVALGYDRSDIGHSLRGSGFVVARRHSTLRVTACTWVSSKWESRAPGGCALLRAFLGGSHDPDVVDLSDDALVNLAIRDLDSVLRLRAEPVLQRVYRWNNAGAQHTIGHRLRMAGLRERLRQLPGLFVAGSGFDSIGIPDCVAHGRREAAAASEYVTP